MKLFKTLCAIFLFSVIVFACKSDDDSSDENDPQNPTSSINFTLDGTAYVLTNVTIMVDPLESNLRRVEATFSDDPTRKILFWIEIAAPFGMRQFIYEENGNSYLCDLVGCDRSVNITTNTNSKMEGTFTLTFRDTTNNPTFRFTNGVINVSY